MLDIESRHNFTGSNEATVNINKIEIYTVQYQN